MQNPDSFKNLIALWERLLAAVRANEADLPHVGPYKQQLTDILEELKAGKLQQQILTVRRIQITAQLQRQLAASRDLVSRIQSLVKASLGPRSDRLRQFGMPPRRQRAPRPFRVVKEDKNGSPENDHGD